ncbi:MAG: hypothetical protein RLZZ628_4000 [Bacteroidota bacterium]|jgi:hypothetical protein
MIGFGLITEGITDQIVIENILYGIFDTRVIPLTQLTPRIDEGDYNQMVRPTNWLTVLEYCQSDEFRAFLRTTSDYAIIQLDTDALKGDSVPLQYRIHLQALQQANPAECVKIVVNQLVMLIGNDFYETFKDRILFAISVDSIECWLLPFYWSTQKAKAAKTANCLEPLNEGLKKAGISIYIHAKNPDNYRKISKLLRKHKEFMKLQALNPSLAIFVESVQKRNIAII